MLGFSCSGTADRNYPEIGDSEEKILSRFLELYRTRGDLLDRLVQDARKKLSFSEDSVRFWAPNLIEGSFGPLEPLLSEDLEEIMVNGVSQPIFVYDRRKGMEKTNLRLTSPEYFVELANRMLAPLGRRVNRSNPREFGILESGDRVSVVLPPYGREPTMSIRKYSAEPFTILDLIDRGMLGYDAAAFLWTVFEAGNMNVGVVGNTGSGKTTLLNALTRFIPKNNRVILVEDIPEISPLQEQVVSLISNKDLEILMRDSILDSLRLRPDRVIIGEVRKDSEVMALHESCLAGHSMGTYFTYHAESLDWARRRLLSQGFPDYDIRAIDLFVVCKRFEREGRLSRRVTEIGSTAKVFSGDRRTGEFSSEYWEAAFDDPWDEVSKRSRFLKGLRAEGDRDVFKKLQEVSHGL